MFTSTVSRRGNRCAQVYATEFGRARAFLMASRKANETLSLLFAWDDAPLACNFNNVKDMIQN